MSEREIGDKTLVGIENVKTEEEQNPHTPNNEIEPKLEKTPKIEKLKATNEIKPNK